MVVKIPVHFRDWTPLELALVIDRALRRPGDERRVRLAYGALEELRTRALHAPFPLPEGEDE